MTAGIILMSKSQTPSCKINTDYAKVMLQLLSSLVKLQSNIYIYQLCSSLLYFPFPGSNTPAEYDHEHRWEYREELEQLTLRGHLCSLSVSSRICVDLWLVLLFLYFVFLGRSLRAETRLSVLSGHKWRPWCH